MSSKAFKRVGAGFVGTLIGALLGAGIAAATVIGIVQHSVNGHGDQPADVSKGTVVASLYGK